MTEPMDVLVVESHPHVGDHAIDQLTAAGHRVHRCHDEHERGFPCRGVSAPDECPASRHLDVALVIRRQVMPRPTPLEDGVTCALRAGVPVIEDGPDVLDPFAPWLTARLRPGEDVVGACEAAAHRGQEPLIEQIRHRISVLLRSVGIAGDEVEIDLVGSEHQLNVHLRLPHRVARNVEHALSVRVLDAAHSSAQRYGQINVHVTAPS